jgi:hypothetical protein
MAWPGRMYSVLPEHGAWQSAMHLKADCQGVIPVVANRCIWAQSLASGWIPVPAILHRQFPCIVSFLCATLSVKPMYVGLFRPKLCINTVVSVCHTTSLQNVHSIGPAAFWDSDTCKSIQKFPVYIKESFTQSTGTSTDSQTLVNWQLSLSAL